MIGDEQGLEFLLDICRPNRQGRNHFLVPLAARDTVRPEDMSYLRENHVFDLPSKDLQFELMWHYIRYIHPTCPVVDVTAFLQESAVEGEPTSSLILLWSMFSVSAAVCTISLVYENKCSDRVFSLCPWKLFKRLASDQTRRCSTRVIRRQR